MNDKNTYKLASSNDRRKEDRSNESSHVRVVTTQLIPAVESWVLIHDLLSNKQQSPEP